MFISFIFTLPQVKKLGSQIDFNYFLTQSNEVIKPLDQNSDKRPHRLTEKAQQYCTNLAIEAFQKSMRNLKRSLKDLDVLVYVSEDPKIFKDAVKDIYAKSDIVENALSDLESYLCSANFKVYADRFEALESEQKECIAKARETLQTFIRLNDRRSECSSSSHSERRQAAISSKDACSASVPTGKSSKASLHEEHLLKVEKVAELKTQLSFHAAQAKLKEKRASLEEEERRLALECQIVTLEAGVKVSVEAEQMEENNRFDHLSTIPYQVSLLKISIRE